MCQKFSIVVLCNINMFDAVQNEQNTSHISYKRKSTPLPTVSTKTHCTQKELLYCADLWYRDCFVKK